jgi:hypothetical protein
VFSESKQEKELHAKERAIDEERNELMAKVHYQTENLCLNEGDTLGYQISGVFF